MHYNKFNIERYKAITTPLTIFVVKDKLLPIIGINECGKTTILQGIFAFDYTNDTFSSTVRHLSDVNNLYDAKSNDAIVSASITIDKDELLDIIKAVELNTDQIISGKAPDPNRTILSATGDKSELGKLKKNVKNLSEIKEVTVRRTLPAKTYSVFDEVLRSTKSVEHMIGHEIVRRLPYILYFDDFKDSIENLIEIPSDKTKSTAWFQIIERLFRKADPDIDIFEIPQKEERQRKSILSKVKKLLNVTIMREWEAFKLDEREALEIDITYISENDKKYIKLDIVEKDSEGEEHYFYIRDRSKGFYWFFNFVMKLEFNPKVLTSKAGQEAIYLLDEPGSYLHALAQQKLCKKLAQLSKNNVVIYCTHSHYLLDPEMIPLNCIRIADKNSDGEVKLSSIFDYNGSITEKRSAFQPVWDALNIKPSIFEPGENKVVIVEGIYDYYCLSLFKKSNWLILPSVGADSVKYFISLLIAWNADFRALWDNDTEGRNKKEEAEKFFGKEIADSTFRLLPKKSERSSKTIMQDLFEGEDYKLIRSELELSPNTSFEKTMIALYYSKKRNTILKKISEKTKDNFSNVYEVMD